MQGPFRKNDIVGLDIKGRQFIALIESVNGQELLVQPFIRNVTYYNVTSHDVVALWRKTKGKNPVVNRFAGVNF